MKETNFDKKEFAGKVIDCLEDAMTTICSLHEDLIEGDPEETVFLSGASYDRIAGEIGYAVERYNLTSQKITSEEALKTVINVVFRPFLQILAEKGWESYFEDWQRFMVFDKVKEVFEAWDLVAIPSKDWLLKISYSWGDEESDQKFMSEEDAWNEAKRDAMNEVQITIDEGTDADLKFYANQKHIELHYWKDDSWCYYDVVKE